MTKSDYILKSLWHFRKQHMAVLLGTIIATAVLTGALIVGDSVKHSLRQIVESRLGNIHYILQSNDRFVRAKLADEISQKLDVGTAAIVLLEGVSSNPENELRINKTQIVGVDSGFWLLSDKQMPDLKEDEAIISSNTAVQLHLKVNDDLVLRVENLSVIPLNSPYSSEAVPSVSFRLKIKAIASDKSLGKFSLKNNQLAPYNVFVSREFLSYRLDIHGLANAILIAGGNESDNKTGLFNDAISEIWQLKDAGAEINKLDNNGNYEITSDRIFIDKQISESILKRNLPVKTILTYLVNFIRFNKNSTPYSFVTSVSENYLGKELKDEEIIINKWLSDDLNARIGDTLTMSYFVIDSLRNLKTDSSRFIVKEIIATQNGLINRSLMPKFPGFAKAVSCMEWNSNIPIDLSKIRDKDEKYWDEFRGTPKAVISIASGKKLWHNNFGDYTSIRFNDSAFCSGTKHNQPDQEILNILDPKDLNISFTDVKSSGIHAANSGVDFGELFLSLSFFVILAGIILTVMLFVLSLEARKPEIGLLISMGYTRKQILNLRVSESAVTVFSGSILGVFAGILYNYGLLAAINSVWNDIARAPMLDVVIKPVTLFIGFFCGFVISFLSVFITTIRNLKRKAIGLINNNYQSNQQLKNKINNLWLVLMILCFTGSFGLLLYSVLLSADYNAALFLASGGLFMLACLILIYQKISRRNICDSSHNSFVKLAFKNTSANKNRSLTVVALLSIGVFVVIITGANRKSFYGIENKNQSGTGGYSFWVETCVPVINDLNSDYGKLKSGLTSDSAFNHVEFAQFLSMNGDDASCLNLNLVVKPRIIGVSPELFNKRNSFTFEMLKEGIEKSHPWLELNKSYEKNVIPAYADQTVITWGILKKIGDTLAYVNENGKKLYLVLAGGLSASVFQGNILIAEKYFKENFPSAGGSKHMLVDVPLEKQKLVSENLNSSFKDYGIEITKTNDRLSQFNSVTNTYLSVFMILGGLALIIGTLGIGIILYRNMIDRKQEIALLIALGFSKQNVFRLLFFENLFLIITGIVIGLISSFIGILPSFISKNYLIPDLTFVIILLIIIFANCLFWIYLPIKKVLNENILTALRNE